MPYEEDGLREELAQPDGGSLVGTSQSGVTSPTPRTVLEVIRDRPLMLEDKGGGPDKTGAENDAALAAILSAMQTGSRGVLQLSHGDYQFADEFKSPSDLRQFIIRGEGEGRTRIVQADPSKNGIRLPTDIQHTLLFEDFSIVGPGSGTGHGIYNVEGASNETFSLKMHHVGITGFGGDAVHLEDAFTVSLYAVNVGTVGGHGFYGGGNTWNLDSCYVHSVGAGRAAYRILGGNFTAINCNGIDSGETIYDLGKSTLEGDAADGYIQAVLLGCNMESYSKVGLNLRNGDAHIFGCTSIVLPGATNARAYSMRPQQGSIMGNVGAIIQGTATWDNANPIHLKSSSNYGLPFATAYGQGSSGKYTFWSDGPALAINAPVEQVYAVNSTTRGKSYANLQALEVMNVGATGEYRANNIKILGQRKTGWAVDTGTARRAANATYVPGATLSFSASYDQAEHTALAARLALVEAALRDATQTIKALKDDLHSATGHGLIGT